MMPGSSSSTALIAGCGYVGRRVARLWSGLGIRTFAITRSTEKAALLSAEGIHPIAANLASATELPQLPDADVVLWSVGFDRSTGGTREAAWIDGLLKLLAALPTRPTPRRVIYTSSTSVYGDGAGQDFDEDAVPSPNSEGGRACAAAENILRDFAIRTGSIVSILRLAGLYGPDRLLRRITDLRESVPLRTQPDEWLNLIHVDDAVSVIHLVSGCAQPPALLNVVASGSVSRWTYYSTLARLMNLPQPVFERAEQTSLPDQRRHGGNRRVVSRVRSAFPMMFQFDDCESGLRNAIEMSGGL